MSKKSTKLSKFVPFQHRLRILDIKLAECYHILSGAED